MIPILPGPRLFLTPTPREVVARRLTETPFSATVAAPDGTVEVTFPEEWPADALVLFPMMIRQWETDPTSLAWEGTAVLAAGAVAVGGVGCKGHPDGNGCVEIGYGINPSYHNRGYATEMVGVFVEWLVRQPSVRRVTAECRVDNIGSIRVLEKNGFVRTGDRVDPEDGPLILWERR